MTTFSRAPRLDDQVDTKTYEDVAPVSSDIAKNARGTEMTSLERAHAEAMERAKGIDEKDMPRVLPEPQIRAKYKIEVFYGPKRTATGPNVVKLAFFRSGQKLHGGGDELMFMCRNPKDEREGCGSFIPPDAIRGGVAICPGCKKAIKASSLSEYLIGNFSTRSLSQELAKFWHRLEGLADIYCKYDPTDIRYLVMVKRLGAQRAHQLRGKHIYPLKNIIKDTANGSSLENRFFAFLTA